MPLLMSGWILFQTILMPKRFNLSTRAGSIILDGRKAAFLPDSKALLVADLHFEKGSFLRDIGLSPLPAHDTQDTLVRLQNLIEDYAPTQVIALGDSFHDTAAGERLLEADLERLSALITSVPQFVWILGNHDPEIPAHIPGGREDHVMTGGFFLTHHPTEPEIGEVNICGHLHPKARVKTVAGSITNPCYAVSASRIIMPSFGTYTGGLRVDDPAIQTEMDGVQGYYVTHKDLIYPMPVRSRSRRA